MADTHYNLGILLQRQGRHVGATKAYTAATRYRPQLSPAYLNLGLTYSEMGEKKMALEILARATNLSDAGLKDPAANAAARLSAAFKIGGKEAGVRDRQIYLAKLTSDSASLKRRRRG